MDDLSRKGSKGFKAHKKLSIKLKKVLRKPREPAHASTEETSDLAGKCALPKKRSIQRRERCRRRSGASPRRRRARMAVPYLRPEDYLSLEDVRRVG